MASLLSSSLGTSPRGSSFVLLQSSTAQTCLPILRAIVQRSSGSARESLVLICLLYPPSRLLASSTQVDSARIHILDRTTDVPGYNDSDESDGEWKARLKQSILDAVRAAPQGALTVAIDSCDTLLSDLASLSETTRLLSDVLALVRERGAPSRLVLHLVAPSPLLAPLLATRFSPALTHLTAHPAALLPHLAAAYLVHPPPAASPTSSASPPSPADAKFWRVFSPFAARAPDVERLVFGPGGPGGAGAADELVVEALVRGGGGGGAGGRRGVERGLEGWAGGAPCALRELGGLKALFAGRKAAASEPGGTADPTQDLSFNLNLTPEQQRSRAQVPLPYAHEGKPVVPAPGVILYDPDSADDLDDDDPDEDLDI
ncbi:uncharacterized protein BXZ73DRAFT_96918 [Epithele typhae]|uniref:uncharacterized protein n=1 Tax=Epithele typhae TaxID=378194 RepID=UPI0020078799|nr:uncharacterized protein BXZ73DRAFT_96918 [Epithele typhae]KAH9944429.1 hypothetical protein BXZ73DRAFT_96918 [Epithele typhae]